MKQQPHDSESNSTSEAKRYTTQELNNIQLGPASAQQRHKRTACTHTACYH